MTQTTIKKLKRGEFFRFINDENAPLWVRSAFNRIDKNYECYRYDDVNHCVYCKAERKIWI